MLAAILAISLKILSSPRFPPFRLKGEETKKVLGVQNLTGEICEKGLYNTV